MEKNKNRTDLLAAGRKKLQQYRQKKDGKGSKSSGKANKADRDVVTDEASSVAKSEKEKQQIQTTEVSVPDSATELVPDSSFQDSTDTFVATNADVVTDEFSTPSSKTEVSEVGSTVNLANESVPDKGLQISILDDANPTIDSQETIDIVGNPESGYVPVTPLDLNATLDDVAPKAGELNASHGEDQVPDVGAMQEHDHSSLEPDNRTSTIDFSGDGEEDTNTRNATEETGGFPAVASADDDNSGTNNTDVFSDSHSFLPISDGSHMFPDYELTTLPKEDEDTKLPPVSGDSEHASLTSDIVSGGSDRFSDAAFTILPKEDEDIKVLPVSGDSENVSLTSDLISGGEDEFRFLVAAREAVSGGGNLKNDNYMKSGSAERLKQQLYVDNFEKELYHLQLCEEVYEKLRFSDSLDDVEGKNKVLSEELARCRSELGRVTSEMEKLRMNASTRIEELQSELKRSEQQLMNVSSELVESRSLLSDLQVKSETLNVSVALLTDEKSQLEKEKGDWMMENEKLVKELIECKSLLELTRVENVDSERNLVQLMEEKSKLEDEKQDYASEKERLLTELEEWKRSMEALQVENNKLNEVLISEKTERSKLEEANGHFIHENKKFSSDILEFENLVENLRSEIVNLSDNLDLVTNERTKLREEIDHFSLEKEESLTELKNCKAEYEKSMEDGAQRLEQLTEENVSLTNTLHVYEAKIREFGEWKMKSAQKAVQETELVVDNSQHRIEESYILEETFLQHMTLDEVLKQYVSTVEAKKGELVILCEELRKEGIITRRTNSELAEKLSNSESIIHDLNGKLEDGIKNHNLLSNSHKDMIEKIKDLEGTNELVGFVLHKVFDNLQKLVDDAGPTTEETECESPKSRQLEHLEISNYDMFIDRLIAILRERAQLESLNRKYNLELLGRIKDMEELNKKSIHPDVFIKLVTDIQSSVSLEGIEIKSDDAVSSLESVFHFFIKREKQAEKELGLFREKLESKELELNKMLNQIELLSFSVVSYEIESLVFKESLRSTVEQVLTLQSELKLKETEILQSEHRVSGLREKLHIAVSKGKGLIQHRDSLKQSLSATTSELEKCLHELQLKDSALQETETKLRSYSEAGERMEALESELSYIRNSATALRESFLLKDSVLQRIEEILEDLDLPEQFHVSDTIDKIDWLAKSVSQTGSREDVELTSASGDELRTNYEELQNKFYGLAEQNEMLEQSLMERNKLVQQWEQVLDRINIPQQLRSLEPEDKIEWLGSAVNEANEHIQDLEKIRGSLAVDLEESQKRLVDLEASLKSITGEQEQLSHDYNEALLYKIDNDKLQNEIGELQLKLDEKRVDQEHIHAEISRLQDLIKDMLQVPEASFDSSTSDIQSLEGLLRKLVDKYAQHTLSDATELTRGERSIELSDTHQESNLADLKRKLEDAEGDLVRMKDERDRHMETNQSLTHEVEVLEVKIQESQTLLTHEEEKSAGLAREIEALEVRIEEFQKLLVQEEQKSAGFAHEIEALEVKNQEFQKLLSQEEQKSAALAHEVEEFEVKIQECQKLLVQEKQKSAALAHEVEEFEVKNEEFQKLLVQEEQKSVALSKKVEEFEVRNQEFQKFLVQEEQKSASLVHEIKSLELKNQELQNSAALAHEVEEFEVKNQEFQKLLVQEEQKAAALAHEVKSLELKVEELQKLLVQEEQKSATVREKLNVAVRKGKSLVQQRDGMKQNINDLTSEIERLKSELKARENSLLEYQQKMKDLITSQEAMEEKDSEIRFLKNLVSETGTELQDKKDTLNEFLSALSEFDLGVESGTDDPLEKLQQIEIEWKNLQAAMSSSEQDLRKSKRAAELLLAELNEVQERNEDLLEELSRSTREISEVSKQRDSAEAANREERSGQFSQLMRLKYGFDQLRPEFSKIYSLINDVLPKELDYLYDLEGSIKSSLESSDAFNVGIQTLNRSMLSNKVSVSSEFFSDSSTTEGQLDENKIIDLWRFIGSHMRDLITNINGLEEKLQSHSKSLHEEVTILSETVSAFHREMTSEKHSLESMKKEKVTENLMLHKYVKMLYETCKSSVFEIQKSKGHLVTFGEENLMIEGETLSVLEERVTSMVNKLSSIVKDFQSANDEVNIKEMKDTISSLQKELTEKDIQKDRMCVDLVSQIKQAESASMTNLKELESSKSQIDDLKAKLETVNQQHKVLEQRVKELENQESTLVDLHEKVKSLTNALIAKEQEAEALLQALDEEEAQMENLTNKISDLERIVLQKDLDLESSEAARGKALKKLSITVSKFDELHHLSETLLSEVDKLQSQLQERDSEISFLREEITRCTSDSLLALETDKKGLDEIQDILTWLDSRVSDDLQLDGNKTDQVYEHKEMLKKQITSIISELKDLRQVSQSKDDLLHIERSKVEDLMRRREILENSLREKESRLSVHQNDDGSAQNTLTNSEIVEVEPVMNKWPSQGTSQVRSLRKVNNDQLAISIDDMDSDDRHKLMDEDDDKAHGFKSLTTSKLVPRFTRPVTDLVDGLWVSCDRALMRQPLLRLSLILYWAVMHALLAVFVV